MNPEAVAFSPNPAPSGRLSSSGTNAVNPPKKSSEHNAARKHQTPRLRNDGVHLLNFQYPKTPPQKVERPMKRNYQDSKPSARRANSNHHSLFSR
jgi:hypothetical protein